MKVLVTGASGMVGRNLVAYFKEKGVGTLPTDLAGWDASGNLLDKDFVFGTLAAQDFDAIIHLAAITELKKTIEDPKLCFEVNCFGTLNMLELARRKNISRIICACYDAQTRVFTTSGLKRYTELNLGDQVFTIDSSKGVIETHPVTRIHVFPYDGRMIHFDGKRVDLLVTPNHNMLIEVLRKTKAGRAWKPIFEEADAVANRSICRLSSGRWMGVIPEILLSGQSVIRSLVDLFYLIGLFVGDGNLNGRQFQVAESGYSKKELLSIRNGKGHFISQQIHPIKKEYFYPRIFLSIPKSDNCRAHLEDVLNRNSLKWSGYKKSIYINSKLLYRIFEDCSEGSGPRNPHTKRIPRWALNAPPEMLRALLQGLLDSDGHRGRVLTTVSPGLVEDTMELCAKLGFFTVCSLSHSISFLNGRKIESTSVRVSISSHKGTPVFGRSYGNVRSEFYKGNVWCIEVENHNFLVERNGKIAFSGNSSANVFGAPKTNPVTEEAPFDPRVPYDYSKVVCENMAMAFHKSTRLPVALTRSWLLFGEYDQPTRAVIRFIRACLKDEPLSLFNEGRDTTSPTHAANYAKLALSILTNERAVGQAFNFGGEGPVSIRELAETVKRLTGSKSQLNLLPPRTELEKDPQISYPSVKKVQTLLGYSPELTLEQGLQRTIDWVKKEA